MCSKLNIGSSNVTGRYKGNQWVNLDLFNFEGVTVRGDMFNLPFQSDTFDEIHSVHVLEHLTRDKHVNALTAMYDVLKYEGKVYVEVPDFQKTVEVLHTAYNSKDDTLIHKWRTSIYGKTERIGMAHHFGFDEKTLKNMMITAGFRFVDRSEEHISSHYKQEPVLLMVGMKK